VRPSFDCLSWFLNKRDLTIIQIGWGAFDFFSQVSKVNIEEDYSRFNFCQSFRNQIQDIYIIDKDSSLKPPGSQTRGASSIVSDGSNALQFIPEEKWTHVDGLCYQYCEDRKRRTKKRTLVVCAVPSKCTMTMNQWQQAVSMISH
jgi:hypothetical protein